MKAKLLGIAAIFVVAFVVQLPMHLASAATFDDWTLGFNSADNQFDSGPTVTNSGSNGVAVEFTNTVFTPGTPIPNTNNSGCVGLCSNFYYTRPIYLYISSPTVDVVAGDVYAINFAVAMSSFQSTADYHIETPVVTFDYFDPTFSNGCGLCFISLVPNASATFSIDFTPTISGPITFDIKFGTGANPNGAASSSINPFTETGSYQFSNLSITDTSAETPLPATLPLFASGLGALGLLGWRRKRKATARAA